MSDAEYLVDATSHFGPHHVSVGPEVHLYHAHPVSSEPGAGASKPAQDENTQKDETVGNPHHCFPGHPGAV